MVAIDTSPPSKPAEPLIRVEELGMDFGRGVIALDRVRFEVHAGERLVVLGPSGAGKSTLLRCLNRLATPTAGSIWFQGQDVTHLSGRRLRHLRQSVGMIFQQFNLVNRLTVLENVLAGRLRFAAGPAQFVLSHLLRFSRRDIDIALNALDRVGILEKAGQRAGTLSGGQQQRVAIARLLAQEPRVILADEPIASLDPRSTESVMTTLRIIQEETGTPLLVNLHQIDVARRFATRIIGMRRGAVVFDGPPEQLTEQQAQRLYGDQIDHHPEAEHS